MLEFVEIGLLVDCNFRCAYCISEMWREEPWPDGFTKFELESSPLIKWILTHTHNNTLISLTGGEPFLYNDLQTLVMSIPNPILINTNLSLINNQNWILNKELSNRICFRVGLHPTQRTDDYISKIKSLTDLGFHVVANYMKTVDETEDEADEVISNLKNNNILYEVSFQIEKGCGESKNINEKTSAHLKTNSFVDNNKGAVVRCDGYVLACQGIHNSESSRLGNIYDNSFTDRKRKKHCCANCLGLKGFTKVLSTWKDYDWTILFPNKDKYPTDAFYNKICEIRNNVIQEF